MTLLSFTYTDDQDSVMAAHMNRVTQSTLRGELGAAISITTQKTLTDGDFPFLKLTPNANLDVLLPPEASTNHVHVIQNGSGTYTLTVKEDSGTTTIATIGPNSVAMFIPSAGVGWTSIKSISNPAASERVHTLMDGLMLTWNSATSINIGVGACYAENGDWIDATSAITKASLSLATSTWYHVYVYLSAGVVSAEVVTTAPVAWKGTAYSKTGDTSRRYVGSIKSDGSGNVYAFQHVGNNILYNASLSASPFRVLASGTATTNTAVALSGIVPATTQGVILYLQELAASVVLRLANSSGTALIGVRPQSGTTIQAFTDASQNVYYSNSAGGGDSYIDVIGYVLTR